MLFQFWAAAFNQCCLVSYYIWKMQFWTLPQKKNQFNFFAIFPTIIIIIIIIRTTNISPYVKLKANSIIRTVGIGYSAIKYFWKIIWNSLDPSNGNLGRRINHFKFSAQCMEHTKSEVFWIIKNVVVIVPWTFPNLETVKYQIWLKYDFIRWQINRETFFTDTYMLTCTLTHSLTCVLCTIFFLFFVC